MKRIFLALMCIFAISTGVIDAGTKKKVHTIGDSTMANYATDGSTDKRGWAQMLQQFFNSDNVTVNNRGKSGASSKSFYKEASFWPTLVKGGSDEMQAGDYLLIQFAHNDEKTGGTDGDELIAYYKNKGMTTEASAVDYRGTTAFDTYKQYIRKYIDEAKAMGVTPIVVGPICRKYFSSDNKSITRTGQHDLGDKFNLLKDGQLLTGQSVPASDDTYDYVMSAKAVASEYDDVPFINLTELTAKLYLSYGLDYCTNNLFCQGDGTHPGILGATLIAREFAQQLKNQANSETDAKKKAVLQELAKDVIVSNEITFNPISGDLGEAYIGMNITKEYNISAFGLANESGKFTISVTDGFKVSLDKQSWNDAVEVSYSGSSLISSIYVRANITSAGKKTGTLTATDGTNTKTLDLTCSGISLTGGEETTCTWSLNSTSLSATSRVLTGLDVSVFDMEATTNLATPTSPEGHDKMLLFNIKGGSWPGGEIDEVSTRYVQFQATVPSDKEFNLDKISFDVVGWGGNSVCYHAYYATKSDFSDQVLLGEGLSMAAKSAYSISKDVVKKLEEGESIYIRIYPWLNTNSTATGKYIGISGVTIHGVVSEAGAENVTITDASVNFPMQGGADKLQDVAYGSTQIEACMSTSQVVLGKSLGISGTRSLGSYSTATKIQNTSGASLGSGNSDAQAITFTIRPADGFTFIPSKVEFGASRIGTSGGTIGVVVNGSNNASKDLGTFSSLGSYKPADGVSYWGEYSGDVDGIAGTTDEPILVKLNLQGLGANKEIAFHDVRITGTLSGATSTAVKYTLNCTVSPEGAGTITIDPLMQSYKEGKEVTITANNNFGYTFSEWQENGTRISAQKSKTITMDKDRNITAVFTQVPVYTVKTKVTNDMEMSLGSITLSPNEHEGKYEAGTNITATAEESKILKFAGWTDEYMNNSVTTSTRNVTVGQDMELVANYEIQDFIAVFDASKTQTYAYDTTQGYPFSADITWDADRNAQCSIVKVSDGSLLYSKDTGTPVVRNREGVVLTGINGLYQNGYRTTDIAWQYSFSTKKFLSATFTGDMAAKNMAHKQYKAMYSLDGKNFIDIENATWSMTANVVNPISFAIPADAMEKDLVYIRITGTGTEQLSSSYNVEGQFNGLDYYAHSESGVGNVYILGEAEAQDDGKVPSVTSTTPTNNATGISSNGTITVSYSERVSKTDISDAITISGNGSSKEVEPVFSSRSFSFPYSNLAYNVTYTVNIPAGYVVDKTGNRAEAYSFSFTIMNREKPQPRTYNAIVDASLTQLAIKDGVIPATESMPAQYRSIQAAIDAAPSTGEKPYLIYVKEGYYNHPNFTFNSGYGTAYTDRTPTSTATETIRISGGINEYDSCRVVCINKPNIHLIGQDVNKVTIATDRFDGSMSWGSDVNDKKHWDHSRVWYHISAGATIEVQEKGTDFHMEGITVDNENWTKLKLEGPQALCFNISGDRAVLNNVRTRSYQDTYYNGGMYNRTFWNNSEIEGSVDFIYGASDVWFENCVLNINRSSGGYIVAPNHPEGTRWGYVFNNTRITTDDVSDPKKYSIWLGRPWHEKPKTVFLHTTMELTPMDSLWHATMGGLPALWAVYDFHDAQGYKLSESSRSHYYVTENGVKKWGVAKNSLTDAEAAAYTIPNVFSGDGTTKVSGYWDPMPIIEKTKKPVLRQNGGTVTWDADEYAISYVVTVNGKPVAFPTEATYAAKNGDVVRVQSVNEYGALSDMSEPLTVDGSSSVVGDANNDGTISVADLSLIANYILGDRNVSINLQSADANSDGELSVADLSLIATKILTANAAKGARIRRR